MVHPACCRLQKCPIARLCPRIVGSESIEYPDASHALGLLRARHKRPRRRRAAEQRDELAALHHSITSSARCCRIQGTSRSSAFAVLRLITSSSLVGTWTGSSF